MVNNSDIIEKTADIIEERDWCTGDLIDSKTGAICVDGALALALELPSMHDIYAAEQNYPKAIEVAQDIVDALGIKDILDASGIYYHQPTESVDSTVTLYRWNDLNAAFYTDDEFERERDKQRVLDGLRKAAKITRLNEEAAE